jgi:hypothetical protein
MEAQFGVEAGGVEQEADVTGAISYQLSAISRGVARSAALVCIAAVCAAAAETAQERGKRVVNEALQALGGKAYLAMADRVESGRAYSFWNSQITGLTIAHIYTRYLTPEPGKVAMRERQSFSKDQSYGALFNEQGGWEITFRGARPFPDARVAQWRDSTMRNIFYILRERLNEPGMEFYSQGSDRFENQPVEIVDITDANGVTVTVSFSQLSKLPIRQTFRRRNPEDKMFDTEETSFARYRDVGGGVQWPHDIRRTRNGEKIFELYSESVKINQDLTDETFTLSSKVKILPPAK